MKSKACGILFCYNEEHIIKETLQYYLSSGIDLVVIDNRSTDSTPDIIKDFCKDSGRYSGKIIDVVNLATEGYEWETILCTANDYMHKKLSNYEWIMLIDADAFYSSPLKGRSLLKYMDLVKKCGFNIIHGRLYNFYPTQKDDPSVKDNIERIKYYRLLNIIGQEKIFLYHSSINFYASQGHYCNRLDRRACFNPGFIYRHYSWVSYEQGVEKIFKGRKSRYMDLKMHTHPLYLYMLPIKKDFVKEAKDLIYYDEKKELISLQHFFLIITLVSVYEGVLNISKKIIKTLKKLLKPGIEPKQHEKSPSSKKIASVVLYEPYGVLLRLYRKYLRPYSHQMQSNIIDAIIPPHLGTRLLFDKEFYPPYPQAFHFLMTNYCNAKCIFCNQRFDGQLKANITLESFKTMLSHIPELQAQRFYFSGGGEPLLCPDLFAILQYADSKRPDVEKIIITNGLLIEKYAEDIARSNIDTLTVSVHGLAETNNSIMQTRDSESIFRGLKLLDKHLERLDKNVYRTFAVVVSRLNIEQVPDLIKKAAQCRVDEVRISFCRYFKRKTDTSLKSDDSLYFHQELYERTMKNSIKIAQACAVKLTYDSLFSKKFKEIECAEPWCTVVVDWQGDIYPCTGGEAIFNQKVKSGEYYFGNLLKEHSRGFWFNETYTKLRRTCIGNFKEKNIPECMDCHNTICFKGPNLERSHILN